MSDRSLSQRVIHGAAWSTVVTVVSVPVIVLTTVVVARALGPAGFGAFAFYTFTTGLVFGLSELGLGESLIQKGARAIGRNDPDALLRAVRSASSLSLLRIPIVVVAGFLLLPGILAPSLYALSVVSTLGFIGPSYYLVASSDLAVPSKVRVLSTLLTSAGSMATAVLTERADLTFAAASLGLHITTALQLFGVPRALRRQILSPGRIELERSDLSFGLATFANGQLSGFVFGRSELLFFPAVAEVARGTFAAAQTIAARSTLLLDSVFGALPTAMSTAGGRSQEALTEAFRRVGAVTLLLMALVAPLLTVLVVSVAPPAFGGGYEAVAELSLALTAVSLWQTGTAPLTLVRYANRQIKPLLLAGGLSAVFNLVSAYLLVPRYGAAGAVASNAGSGALYVLLTAGLLARLPRWRRAAVAYSWRLAAVVLGSAGAGLVALALGQGPGSTLLAGLGSSAAVTLLFLLTPVARTTSEERAALKNTVRSVLPRSAGRQVR